eukprot:TRINITY_DN51186_c0_g1_i1.p1 TRINITY_DN51186_c0_g1~~TRINITY_DN51186_c0_g1_i1.p1  ORF type:complete len:405 (+),score=98.59 TRINITY_DN51186_c0_g1_i1:166-1380(+)
MCIRDRTAQGPNGSELPGNTSQRVRSAYTSHRDGFAKASGGTIRWQRGELLGQGSFGKVFSGLDLRTGRLIAVKQVKIGKTEAEDGELKNLEREVQLLQLLDHPNIIKYLGTERGNGVLNILLEFAPGGSIKGVLNQFGPFSEACIRRYVSDIVSGLGHLHAEGIIHRDLKPANMLLEQSGLCKLADFGCSKVVADALTLMRSDAQHTAVGTMQFMAPEVVKEEGYGRSADIWSLGMSILEMATGAPPWPTAANAVYKLAMTDDLPELPHHLSLEAKDFLTLCFQRDPVQRADTKMLSEHDFLTDDSEDPMLLESIHGGAGGKLSDSQSFNTADFGPPSMSFRDTLQSQQSITMSESMTLNDQDALAAALQQELQKELASSPRCENTGWSVKVDRTNTTEGSDS